MSFIWFLLGLLFTAIVYLRLSRRLTGLNLELSEDLKGEIISLIAEFNNSAERNITLIEERTKLAKSISNEIAEKLNYMKDLKESLEKEIKDSELKLRNILVNEKSTILPENRSVVAKQYERVKKQIEQEVVENVKSDSKLLEEEKKIKKIETPMLKKEELLDDKQEDFTVVEEKNASSEELVNNSKEKNFNLQEKVLKLAKEGKSISEIASILEVTRGEVELILKLFR